MNTFINFVVSVPFTVRENGHHAVYTILHAHTYTNAGAHTTEYKHNVRNNISYMVLSVTVAWHSHL